MFIYTEKKRKFSYCENKGVYVVSKKVTTDVHNVFNNTLEQKHLFIFDNEYVFHKGLDTDCNFQDVQCLLFDSNFEIKTMNMKLTYCLWRIMTHIVYLLVQMRFSIYKKEIASKMRQHMSDIWKFFLIKIILCNIFQLQMMQIYFDSII